MSNAVLGEFVDAYLLKNGAEVQVFRNGMILSRKEENTVIKWEDIEITQYCDTKPTCLSLKLKNKKVLGLPLPRNSKAPLLHLIEYQVAKQLVPELFSRLQIGETLDFGAIKVSQFGIEIRGHRLAWGKFNALGFTTKGKNVEVFRNYFPLKEYSTPPQQFINLYTLFRLTGLIYDQELWRYEWKIENIENEDEEEQKFPFPGTLSTNFSNPGEVPINLHPMELISAGIFIFFFLIAILMKSWGLAILATLPAIMGVLAIKKQLKHTRNPQAQQPGEIVKKAIIYEDSVEFTNLEHHSEKLYWKDIKSLIIADAGSFIENLDGKRFDIQYLDMEENQDESKFYFTYLLDQFSNSLLERSIKIIEEGGSIRFENFAIDANGIYSNEWRIPFDLLRWYPDLPLDKWVKFNNQMSNFSLLEDLYAHYVSKPAMIKLK